MNGFIFLKNEEIKESFTAKELKEAQEKLSIMKPPEDEQKAYEHYKGDLHYQFSMFEFSYGGGYYKGKKKGKAEGKIEAIRQIVLNLAKENTSIKTIRSSTGITKEEVELIIENNDER